MSVETKKRESDTKPIRIRLKEPLKFLNTAQVAEIDDKLSSVSPFGEIRLRVENGSLKFVAQSKSYDALKLQRPGSSLEDQD
jgi:hypothetical protein